MDSDLIKKVKSYFKRIENTSEEYLVEEIGYWIIITADSRDSSKHPSEKITYGKFIDAVAYAVQQPEFYHDFCLPQIQEPGDSRSGIVKKINILELKESDLAKIILSSEEGKK